MASMRLCGFLSIVLVSTAGLHAQSSTYYIADGDSNIVYIVQGGAVVDSFSTAEVPGAGLGYAIAVRDTIQLGDRDDGGAAEYTLDGVFTGNTSTGGNGFSEILDGTTDGTSNYGGVFPDGEVIVADAEWEGASLLFDLPHSISGITYDPVAGTLFIVDDTAIVVRQYSLAGSELSSFVPGSLERPCCLAYEAATDTLWLADNANDEVIYQFSKTGTLLATIPVTGLSGNYFGGEMAVEASPRQAPAIPTLGGTGLLLLIGAIASAGALFLLARGRAA